MYCVVASKQLRSIRLPDGESLGWLGLDFCCMDKPQIDLHVLQASWDAQIAFNSKPIEHHIWMGGVTTQLFSSWCQGTFRSSSFGLTSSFALRKERLGKGQDRDENQITWSLYIYIMIFILFWSVQRFFLSGLQHTAPYCTIIQHVSRLHTWVPQVLTRS